MKGIKLSKLIKPTNLYEEVKRRHNELSKIKNELEQDLKRAPKGLIHVVKTSKRTQFYLRNDKTDRKGKYIPKAEKDTIGKYVQKAYDEKAIKLISKEIKNLENLLVKSDSIIKTIRTIYSENSAEIKNIIDPVDISDEDYCELWMHIPYQGKELSEYVPCYETERKERVRSKSELNIANALAAKGIPYKYECPLQLSNGAIIYPDFTVLDVKRRRVLYWEHRGMMDDKEYAKNSVQRIKALMREEIFIGEKLIITEETSTNPLGTNEIDAVIKKYFF